jgi:hypothetical protein
MKIHASISTILVRSTVIALLAAGCRAESDADRFARELDQIIQAQGKIAKQFDTATDASGFAEALDALTESTEQLTSLLEKGEQVQEDGPQDLQKRAEAAGTAWGVNYAAANAVLSKFGTSPSVIKSWNRLQPAAQRFFEKAGGAAR